MFNFIVIDDSALDCFIAEKMIKHTGKCKDIRSFVSAVDAINYIQLVQDTRDDLPTIIILDVLMPIMNGFDFVEAFEKLPASVKVKYKIVALTSSMNHNDTEKIGGYETVQGVLEKPLTSETIAPILA